MLDYSPQSRGPPFYFVPIRHFWKASTSSSHQALILGYLLTLELRSRGEKCTPLSALVQEAHGFSFVQARHFWKAPTSSSHQNFIFGYLLTREWRSGGLKCA